MYGEILTSMESGSKDSKNTKERNSQKVGEMRGSFLLLLLFFFSPFLSSLFIIISVIIIVIIIIMIATLKSRKERFTKLKRNGEEETETKPRSVYEIRFPQRMWKQEPMD